MDSPPRLARVTRGVSSGCCAILVLLLGVGAPGCGPDTRPKNIVLIVVDTLRRDRISPYVPGIQTPNIQRLADEGQVFPNCIASFHQTTMSMGSMFTGQTPSAESGELATPLAWTGRNWCGLARYADGPDDTCVPQGLETLAERMRDAGYRTIGVVSNRMLFRPRGYEQGFDEWIEVAAKKGARTPGERARLRSAPRVREAVARAVGSGSERRTFLYIHYVDVHDYPFADTSYQKAVGYFDAELGKLLDQLRDAGFLEDAVIFFTADHGESFGELHALDSERGHMGNPSFETVLRIPLIVTPARFENPSRLVRGQDIPSLVLEVANESPLRAVAAAPLEPGEVFLGERSFLTYREGRWKSTFHRRKLGEWALFDLEADPLERRNLAAEQPEVFKRHLTRVRELVVALGSEPLAGDTLGEEDAERLRALGYLE